MDQDRSHGKRVGNETSMLTARTAEAVERVVARVIAFGD